MGWTRFKAVTTHPILYQPIISLGLTGISLLLLVLVLLSVPGPIKGLYWFSVESETTGEGNLSTGVLGWCSEFPWPVFQYLASLAGANDPPSDRYVQLHLRALERKCLLVHYDQHWRGAHRPFNASPR